jgi:hypothetical protein
MNPSPVSSFLRFFASLALVLGLSLGITLAVNSYTVHKDALQAATAAKALMLRQQ